MEELVQIIGKEVMCDSIQVSKSFGKRHDRVLRSVENLLGNLPKNEDVKILEDSYIDAKGEKRKKYIMNRDGFSLLVMGFTGKKALEWKLKYIQAFNLMEKKLTELQSQDRLEARQQSKRTRLVETDAIKRFVASAKQQGSKHANWYYANFSKLANKACGITDRDTATMEQLVNLAAIENIIAHSVDNGISEEKFYKDIYKEADLRVEAYKEIAYIGTCLTDTERKERSKNL